MSPERVRSAHIGGRYENISNLYGTYCSFESAQSGHNHPAAFFFAPLFNQAIFADSSPGSSQTKSSCEKTPRQCSSLCQTDLLAETRAAELEKYLRKARKDADKAAQKAAAVAKSEAAQARADADNARQSYQSCLSEKESQPNSP
jgi:hypothetical protein